MDSGELLVALYCMGELYTTCVAVLHEKANIYFVAYFDYIAAFEALYL